MNLTTGKRSNFTSTKPKIDHEATKQRITPPNIVILAAITTIGTMAMHILVPVLPDIAEDFSTSGSSVQLTITIFLAGLAIGQLFYGAISDKYGRKPVLLVGMTIYCVGMALAIPAQSIEALLAARLLQGIGGCAGLVLGRAMVQDGSGDKAATGRLAILTMTLTASPAFAPLVGRFIGDQYGWRALFILLGVAGLVLSIWCYRYLPETNERRSANLNFRGMLANFRDLLCSRVFLGYAIGGASSTTSCFVFLGALPFLMVNYLGRPAGDSAYAYIAITGGVTFGSFLANRISSRINPRQGARLGSWITIAASVLLFAFAILDMHTIATMIGPFVLFAVGMGVAGPNSMGGALHSAPSKIGSASSLYGFIQMMTAAILTALPAMIGSQTPLTLSFILIIATSVGQVMLWRINIR